MQQPVLVDAYAAQAATGVKPVTLRTWLHRGVLTRHGHDRAGRALLDLDELEEHLKTLQTPLTAEAA